MVEAPLSDDELRAEAFRRIKKRRDFFAHLVVYVVVNAFLVGIWYFSSGGGYFWPAWVMGGWGIAIALNAWDTFFRKPITRSDIQQEMDKLGRGE